MVASPRSSVHKDGSEVVVDFVGFKKGLNLGAAQNPTRLAMDYVHPLMPSTGESNMAVKRYRLGLNGAWQGSALEVAP